MDETGPDGACVLAADLERIMSCTRGSAVIMNSGLTKATPSASSIQNRAYVLFLTLMRWSFSPALVAWHHHSLRSSPLLMAYPISPPPGPYPAVYNSLGSPPPMSMPMSAAMPPIAAYSQHLPPPVAAASAPPRPGTLPVGTRVKIGEYTVTIEKFLSEGGL